jgi:chaperonin cofactor prefoldin
MTVGVSTFPVKMVEDLKARIKELEDRIETLERGDNKLEQDLDNIYYERSRDT